MPSSTEASVLRPGTRRSAVGHVYSPALERIAIRELRNHASRVVRRARAGERIVITVDGLPVAQIVPLDDASIEPTFEALIAQGRLLAPRSTRPPAPAAPISVPGSRTTADVLRELRER